MINQIADFLNEHPDTDSILFGNNRLATCGLKALRNLNKRVPEDIALISFDDYEVFELSNPPVTAIAQPIDNIADQVITILLNRLNTSAVNNNKQHVILPTDLKVRKST
jgi:LacI family transcriptional regulator